MSTNAHDLFMKFALAERERAAEILSVALGASRAGQIDWSTLTPDTTELADEVLGRSFPDMRWRTRLQESEVRLNVVFEHQSTFDRLMPVRFFCHTGAIWNSARLEKEPRILLILNVILHNGPKPWPVPPELWTAIEGGEYYLKHMPEALPGIPVFTYDLAVVTDEQIRSLPVSAAVKLMLLSLKHAPTGDAVSALQSAPELVAGAPEDVLRKTVGYVLRADSGATVHNVTDAISGAVGRTRGEEVVMTEGERLEAKGEARGEARGLQKGLEQGLVRGQAQAVLRFLERRGVRLSADQQAQISACEDAEQVTRWLDAAATANSAEDLFGPTKH